jgi:hypothetical protein
MLLGGRRKWAIRSGSTIGDAPWKTRANRVEPNYRSRPGKKIFLANQSATGKTADRIGRHAKHQERAGYPVLSFHIGVNS